MVRDVLPGARTNTLLTTVAVRTMSGLDLAELSDSALRRLAEEADFEAGRGSGAA